MIEKENSIEMFEIVQFSAKEIYFTINKKF